MIKDDVLAALGSLGFIPDEIKDFGYRFDYEGLTLLYQVDEEESKCLTFSVPNVFAISDDNRLAALEGMVKLSTKMKYVKPHIMFENQVWVNYQHYVGDNEVNPNLIEHIILVLAYSTIRFHNIINRGDNDY